jgi:3-oxoadipate enol-lactonase
VTEVAWSERGPAEAPVLLLASSLGTARAMWEPQIDALSDRWRVVAYDHRGHGASPSPPGPWEIADIARNALDLIDGLGVERVAFCGLSLGAMVGMWLAAHAPERVTSLVLCCTTAWFPDKEPWLERAAAVRAAGSTEPVADAVVARWLTPGYAEAHPDALARLRGMLVSADAAGYAEACDAIRRMDLRDDLRAIRAPTLVVAGADDLATPLEHLQRIADSVAGARLEVVPRAAHVASVEQAETVTALIRDHIEEAR